MMPLSYVLIPSFVLTILFFFLYVYYYKKEDSKIPANRSLLAFIVCLIILLLTTGFFTKASAHGAYTYNETIHTLSKAINIFPRVSDEVEDISPLKNKVVVYFRIKCSLCQTIIPELEKELASKGINPLWVSSRTPFGKKLRDAYPIEKVPMMVYIDKEGKGQNLDPSTEDHTLNYDILNILYDLLERNSN